MTKTIAEYDEFEIWKNRKEFLMKEKGVSEDRAEQMANQDAFIYGDEWQNMIDALQSAMNRLTKNRKFSNLYRIKGQNIGWRGTGGDRIVENIDAEEVIDNVTNNTTKRVVVKEGDGFIRIEHYGHDTRFSPGADTFKIFPVDADEGEEFMERGVF